MDAHAISVNIPDHGILTRQQKRLQKLRLVSLRKEYFSLMGELANAQQSLTVALNNFEYLTDSNSVDVCIYQLKSAQSQYDNILGRLKPLRLQITAEGGSV